jgi:hypothetical protein
MPRHSEAAQVPLKLAPQRMQNRRILWLTRGSGAGTSPATPLPPNSGSSSGVRDEVSSAMTVGQNRETVRDRGSGQ